MSASPCPRSDELLVALQAKGPSEDLSRHAEGCLDCSDLLLVHQQLAFDARELAAEQPSFDARALWWMARLEGREERARRATWTIHLCERLGLAFALGLLLLGFQWQGPALLRWMLQVLDGPSSLVDSHGAFTAFILVTLAVAALGLADSHSET
ncbi:MAG: hypothetical protein AAF604_17760 [Acidobacteriota bacterium]